MADFRLQVIFMYPLFYSSKNRINNIFIDKELSSCSDIISGYRYS